MVRQARPLPKFSDTYVNPISIRGVGLCPTIGFASPKKFRDYAPECVHKTKGHVYRVLLVPRHYILETVFKWCQTDGIRLFETYCKQCQACK